MYFKWSQAWTRCLPTNTYLGKLNWRYSMNSLGHIHTQPDVTVVLDGEGSLCHVSHMFLQCNSSVGHSGIISQP